MWFFITLLNDYFIFQMSHNCTVRGPHCSSKECIEKYAFISYTFIFNLHIQICIITHTEIKKENKTIHIIFACICQLCTFVQL